MTFPILASLLVRLVVLLPFQLLRLSLATPSRWTPLALSVFLHCVVALDRKSGSAGMPRPISYAVFCLKKKKAVTYCFDPRNGRCVVRESMIHGVAAARVGARVVERVTRVLSL